MGTERSRVERWKRGRKFFYYFVDVYYVLVVFLSVYVEFGFILLCFVVEVEKVVVLAFVRG